MPRSPERQAFVNHRNRAARAGIDFLFSYEEWISWWERNLGPDWMRLRGCRRWHFVMARRGDIGPYSAENVDCLTCSENNAAAFHARPTKTSLSERQVSEIRLSYEPNHPEKGMRALGRKYGVCHGTMQRVIHGRSWKNVGIARREHA